MEKNNHLERRYQVLTHTSMIGTCIRTVFYDRNDKLIVPVVVFIIFAAGEQNGVMSTISDKPVAVKNFTKHCEQRRKFPILYKIEFQVS